MYKDTNLRTILKTISWRITATTTTVIIVYIFTGQIDTAIEVGLMEMVAKMLIYYFHERGWDKLKFGKKEIPSFVVWITGIPLSGKTTIGDLIADELKKDKRKHHRLDSHTVRALFPETGFEKNAVQRHIKRVGHLASILEKNGIVVIASFVSPYRESRQFVRGICSNFVEVHLNVDPDDVEKYDRDGFYKKARSGKYINVPGISSEFEVSENPELSFDMKKNSLEEVAEKIIKYLHANYN